MGARVSILSGNVGVATAECASGEVATGGGIDWTDGNTLNPQILDQGTSNPQGWIVSVFNPGPNEIQIEAIVQCAKLVDAP